MRTVRVERTLEQVLKLWPLPLGYARAVNIDYGVVTIARVEMRWSGRSGSN